MVVACFGCGMGARFILRHGRGCRRLRSFRACALISKRRAFRKAAKYAAKNPRKTLRHLKRARKAHKLYKKLPGFDTAVGGKWHYRGEEWARDEATVDPTGTAGTLLFWPVNYAVTKAVNKLPPFREPKPTFKRPKGLNERPIYRDRIEVEYRVKGGESHENRMDRRTCGGT